MQPFVDIHCHMLPGLDDGSKSWDESLAMAQMASADGIGKVIATTHQLGAYSQNDGDTIRSHARQFQELLTDNGTPLQVLPGADVRIEPGMTAQLCAGSVLTLGDRGRHVLLELPHELYFPLEPVLDELQRAGMVGILSHPERNQGILSQPDLVPSLVASGCLMQVTAGSLMGTFGPHCQQLADWMVRNSLTHFVATDAHGIKKRRPLMDRAYQRVIEIAGHDAADQLCRSNPEAVSQGNEIELPQASQPSKWKSSRFLSMRPG